jgi:hypothetical protein
MYIFWENVARFPRFLVTSVSGLIIILISPLLKLAKKNLVSQIFLLLFVLVFTCFLIFILGAMLDV